MFFIKRRVSGCVINVVYVEDLNIIGRSKEIMNAIAYLKKEFEVKDFGKTNIFSGLKIEHLKNGI